MNPRAVVLIAVLLAPAAWAQESATETQVVTAQAFDLRNDSIKKIVRDFAATQSVSIQFVELAPAKREPLAKINLERPEKRLPEPPLPRRAPAKPSASSEFFSALVGAVLETGLDSLLDADDGYTCVSHDGFCVSSDTMPPMATN